MDLPRLIESLADPLAYPYAVDAVEVRQTHISVVFLAGSYVYKIKKPVDLGFLDFSTLEKRRHFCEEEVRLNRRLAADVYLGVVPVSREDDRFRWEGTGTAVEWAVKMARLPDEARLQDHLERGAVNSETMARLAGKIAAFHRQAEHGPRISQGGSFAVVAGNVRENFEQSANQMGVTVSPTVFDRLQTLSEESLAHWRSLIESRAARNVPCDTHGDLRLDHVYLLPDRRSPDDMIVIDCIEFSERFRFADPVADMAFLVMGLASQGHDELARNFTEAYFQATGDDEGRQLLAFYIAYRAAVRAKVAGITMGEAEVPQAERREALAEARSYWLLALGKLERPNRRPGLVLIGGLPGAGKSTLAATLAERADFTVIRSDVVRKELAGISPSAGAAEAFEQGMYTAEWTERTYAECLRRAEQLLFEGKRGIVDASFREEASRRRFLDAAARMCVPSVLLICEADPQEIRVRLANRRGDASDADWSIYEQAAAAWQPPEHLTRASLTTIKSSGPIGGTGGSPVEQALAALHGIGLHETQRPACTTKPEAH